MRSRPCHGFVGALRWIFTCRGPVICRFNQCSPRQGATRTQSGPGVCSYPQLGPGNGVAMACLSRPNVARWQEPRPVVIRLGCDTQTPVSRAAANHDPPKARHADTAPISRAAHSSRSATGAPTGHRCLESQPITIYLRRSTQTPVSRAAALDAGVSSRDIARRESRAVARHDPPSLRRADTGVSSRGLSRFAKDAVRGRGGASQHDQTPRHRQCIQ